VWTPHLLKIRGVVAQHRTASISYDPPALTGTTDPCRCQVDTCNYEGNLCLNPNAGQNPRIKLVASKLKRLVPLRPVDTNVKPLPYRSLCKEPLLVTLR
jgi:hypothetical protein